MKARVASVPRSAKCRSNHSQGGQALSAAAAGPKSSRQIFPQGLSINGRPVHWIECKCYYGSATHGVHGDLSLQRLDSDYIARWGPGAVVFGFGYCEALHINDNVLLLDSSTLDLPELHAHLESFFESAP